MYIYNVTVNLDKSIHNEWLNWIKSHIPEVLASGKFTKATLTKVLVEEAIEGFTYSIQYHTHSRETLDAFYKEDAERINAQTTNIYGDKLLTFTTELQIIDDYSVKIN